MSNLKSMGARRAVCAAVSSCSFALTPAALGATLSYTGPGGAIPDASTFASPIVISEDLTIVNLTVTINGLQHDACGQIEASLFNPFSGTTIELIDRPGGFADDTNFNGTYTFDTNALDDLFDVAGDLGDGDDLPSGTYAPAVGTLLAFAGDSTAATWVLLVTDTTGGTAGSLTDWTLDIVAAAAPQAVLYVDDDGPLTGDGMSWATAYRDLRTALFVADAHPEVVEEIRIGQGTYRPTLRLVPDEPRTASFSLVDGVSLFGGYAGTGAPDPDARDAALHPTILSGDQFANDIPGAPQTDPSKADNSGHVLIATGVTPATVVDGLTVRDGVTYTSGSGSFREGAGLYSNGGSPTISNCVFRNNWANAGGGAIFGINDSAMLIDHCSFIENDCGAVGGALFVSGGTLTVMNSSFVENTSDDGGAGVMLYDGCNAIVESCTFTENVADGANTGGGAIRLESDACATITDCVFTGNRAANGGAIAAQMVACVTTVTDCDFIGNEAQSGRGGACAIVDAVITDCAFEGNTGSSRGGAISAIGSLIESVIEGCTFIDNSCSGSGGTLHLDGMAHVAECTFDGGSASVGGAIYGEDTTATIVDVSIIGHDAEYGGAFYWEDDSTPTIINAVVVGNHATLDGGGANQRHESLPLYVNCLFSGNTAGRLGGAVATRGGEVTLINCTLSGNHAVMNAGGIFVGNLRAATVLNSIVWGNHDDSGNGAEDQQVWLDGGGFALRFSTLEGLTGSFGGVGNLGSNPLLIDPDGADDVIGTLDDDARLTAGSPSQDTGDPTALPMDTLDIDGDGDFVEPLPIDLDGLPRAFDFIVDRGAYEVQQSGGGGTGMYIGAPGGSWSEPTNWGSGTVPDARTSVVIMSSVVVDAPGATAASITILDGGTLAVTTGTMLVETLVVTSGGTLVLDDAAGVLTVDALTLLAGGTLALDAGRIDLVGGELTSAMSVVYGCAGTTATIDLGAGGTISAPVVELCADGVLTGSGTVDGSMINAGTIDIGGATAGAGMVASSIDVTGAYFQHAGGTLVVELSSYTASATADLLDVTGVATLDGALVVFVPDPSNPEIIDRAVVRGAALSGEFTTIDQTDPDGLLEPGSTITPTEFRVGASLPAERLYVDADATPGGTGVSWAEAYVSLEDALVAAALAGGDIEEVWVAEGTYVPVLESVPGDPRSASFLLAGGLTIYGGFDGTEALLEERDPVAHVTILSGDRFGDDGPDFQNTFDNVRNVVRAESLAAPAVVDGVTIQGGNSDGSLLDGAGARVDASDVSFRRCRFTSNQANHGGGAAVLTGAQLTIDTCVMEGNEAAGAGGGVLVDGGAVTIEASIFTANFASQNGGAVALRLAGTAMLEGCDLTANLTNDVGGAISVVDNALLHARDCDFIRNGESDGPNADEGGAIHVFQAVVELVACDLHDNFAGNRGGGIYSETSTVTAINCRIIGNRTASRGGGIIARFSSTTTLTNCLVTGNYADREGGGIMSESSTATLHNCVVAYNEARLDIGGGIYNASNGALDVSNSILWGNSNLEGQMNQPAQVRGNGPMSVNRTCIMSYFGGLGSGNFADDPRFVDADGADDVHGTFDDAYQLFYGSPCLDRGDSALVPADVFDLDGDLDVAELVPFDLAGNARFIDDPQTPDTGIGLLTTLDIGAYELDPVCPGCDGPRLWTAAAGGAFDVDGNWFPNAPSRADAAIFDVDGSYEVTFPTSVATSELLVTAGDVLFSLNGATYDVTSGGDAAFVVGEFPGRSARLTVSGGTLSATHARVSGQVDSDGTLLVTGAATAFEVAGSVRVGEKGLGDLTIEAGATMTAPDTTICESGELVGDGTVVGSVVSHGRVDPGTASGAGLLTIDGAYDQQTGMLGEGDLAIELGGTARGVDYDALDVTGTATLSGTLTVTLDGAYQPAMGDVFTVLDAGALSGAFDIAFLPTLRDDLTLVVSYEPDGSVRLTTESTGLGFFSFADPVEVGGFSAPSASLAADLDGDGNVDVAVTVPAADDNDPGSLLIFRNAGVDGSGAWLGFEPGFDTYPVGREPRAIVTGYFNDDEFIDLAVANWLGPNVTVHFNDFQGNGNFFIGATLPVDQGMGVHTVAAGNFYGGARDDLVFVSSSPYRKRFYENDGSGAFTFRQQIGYGTTGATYLDVADLDHDGDHEVVQVNFGTTSGLFSGVTVSTKAADGINYELADQHYQDVGALSMFVRDLDLDGFEDVCTVNDVTSSVSVLLNSADGSPTLTAPFELTTGAAPTSMQAIDFDGDGAPDLAIAAENEVGQRVIQMKRNQILEEGRLLFTDASPVDVGGGVQFVLSNDVNADGSPDLITVNLNPELGPDGEPQGSISVLLNELGGAPPCIGDLDGDGQIGFSDLVAVLSAWGPCTGCDADLDGNGAVDFADLLTVLSAWGACP